MFQNHGFLEWLGWHLLDRHLYEEVALYNLGEYEDWQ